MVFSISPVRFSGRQSVVGKPEQLKELEKEFIEKAAKHAPQTEVAVFHVPKLSRDEQKAFKQSFELVKKDAKKNGETRVNLREMLKKYPELKAPTQTFLDDWFGPGINVDDHFEKKTATAIFYTGEDAKRYKEVAPILTTYGRDIVMGIIGNPAIVQGLLKSKDWDRLAKDEGMGGSGSELKDNYQKMFKTLMLKDLPDFLKADTEKISKYQEWYPKLKEDPKVTESVTNLFMNSMMGVADEAGQQKLTEQLADKVVEATGISEQTGRAFKFMVAPWLNVAHTAMALPFNPQQLGKLVQKIPKSVSAQQFQKSLDNADMYTKPGYAQSLLPSATKKIDLEGFSTLFGYSAAENPEFRQQIMNGLMGAFTAKDKDKKDADTPDAATAA